ncbi:MAG: urease accessory protein UreD [Rubrivivax sp.]|jgi:urease accessory protein
MLPVHTPPATGWRGHLRLHYSARQQGDTRHTLAHDLHEGPLRVLQRLYPEGPGICHHVLVHPPGGVVGGDELLIDARLDAGTHALVTTPGATRFYRSEGALGQQQARLQLAEGARLEWLPLENIAYSGCLAENRVELDLATGAQALGWDTVALGLPAAGQAFERGQFVQQLHWPGRWLERGVLAAEDRLLLDSPLGLAGHRVLATLWFASGTAMQTAQREALLEAARAAIEQSALPTTAGATAPNDHVVVLRLVAARVEPAFGLLTAVRAAWRQLAWGLPANPPRLWRC